jgi:hypothetical protein
VTSPAPIRVAPATAVVHLDFAAGEDVDVELEVLDDSRPRQPVPLQSAVATIAVPDGPVLHEWSAARGNLELHPSDENPGIVSRVRLLTTREQTAAWYEAWGDAEWQLDAIDIFGKAKRPCEGLVRVRLSLRGGAG